MLSPASISAAKCMTPSKLPFAQGGLDEGSIGEVAFNKSGLMAAERFAPAVAEIVVDRYLDGPRRAEDGLPYLRYNLPRLSLRHSFHGSLFSSFAYHQSTSVKAILVAALYLL